ncbi:MAG: hypothetical protein P8X48_02565 [Acidiferrobacteraceae bacterium]|jgi:hypothetical protein
MTNGRHRIEIYEPAEFTSQPLNVHGISVIESPEHKQAYLCELDDAIRIDEGEVHEVVLRPRHDDPIDRCVSSTCTVLISCVKPGQSLTQQGDFRYTDVINWGVGKITPVEVNEG